MARRRNDLLVDVRKPIRQDVLEGLRDLGLSKKKAAAVLDTFPDGRGLWDAGMNALVALGLTQTEAKRVRAAFRVADACDRSCKARALPGSVRTPSDAVDMFRRAIGRQEQEVFAVALMDARQQVIDVMAVAVGSLADVSVHPRELFREAVRRGAHSVILAHNHPSGDSSPSDADVQLTQRMVDAGQLVGIPVLDHMVITPTEATSLAAAGLLQPHRSRNPTALRRSLV